MRSIVFVLVFALAGAAAAAPPMTGSASATDIVIDASDISQAALSGSWTLAHAEDCADGVKLVARGDGAAVSDAVPATNAIQNPLPTPNDYFDVSFSASSGTPYRLWLRLRSGRRAPASDGVWVQFSDALVDGKPAYRVGTDTALLVTEQPCSGCVLSGWGWHDSSWSLSQPSIVTFAGDGPHTLRIQAAAAGVEIDQIVLSPRTYLNGPPGPALDDVTKVRKQ